MHLQHYTDSYSCEYSPENGRVDKDSIEHIDFETLFEERMKNRTDVGYCAEIESRWVALYAGKEGLILQIEDQKWLLMDGNLKTAYIENVDDNTIIFSAWDKENKVDITYKKWWENGRDYLIDPVYASQHPDNVDNDLFAFVDHLNGENGDPENALANWRKTSTSQR